MQSEGPDVAVSLFEVWSTGDNLMHKVFNAAYLVLLTKNFVNNVVIDNWDAGARNLAVSTGVDELADGLNAWLTPCDIVSHVTKCVQSGLVAFDEGGGIDRLKAQ